MNKNQAIRVQLRDMKGNKFRCANIYFSIHFLINGNYRYGFYATPTDNNGEVYVDYEYLDSARRKMGSIFLMDYNTPLEDCDEEMRLSLPDSERLRMDFVDIKKFEISEAIREAKKRMDGSNYRLDATSLDFSLAGPGVTKVDFPVVARINGDE